MDRAEFVRRTRAGEPLTLQERVKILEDACDQLRSILASYAMTRATEERGVAMLHAQMSGKLDEFMVREMVDVLADIIVGFLAQYQHKTPLRVQTTMLCEQIMKLTQKLDDASKTRAKQAASFNTDKLVEELRAVGMTVVDLTGEDDVIDTLDRTFGVKTDRTQSEFDRRTNNGGRTPDRRAPKH